MLDPQAVLIGHMGAYLPDKYIQMLDRLVNSRILPSGYKRVEVVRASFGDTSPLMGSACLVLNAYFEGILNSDTRNFSENI
jgi:predicted NBD/HSP70 family sugar kinase